LGTTPVKVPITVASLFSRFLFRALSVEKHYMSFAELKADATQAVAYMCFDYGFTADKITISEKPSEYGSHP